MDRFVLTGAQWAKMEPLCLGKASDPGRSGRDNRLFVEAVLWIVRTGSPWRDLPAHRRLSMMTWWFERTVPLSLMKESSSHFLPENAAVDGND
ncbi:transposase [Methylosinus sp. RM1]|uniref:transposase n=1 Tax=Methylosinus sp. RM1 TaxID=2583817 RepID=UPI00210567C5|nr:transposase [Methylosinus sp. RM1]